MSCSKVSPITVLVTRSAGQSSQFTELLLAAGLEVIEMPALEIRSPSSWQSLDNAIGHLNKFDWLILTSANAVTYFFERLKSLSPVECLDGLRFAVVGKKTASVLATYGYQPDFVPPSFVADSLVENFPEKISGLNVLFPRVESGGRDTLVKEMVAAGGVVTEVPAYESGCPQAPDADAIAALRTRRINVVTFASSKTVRHACQLFKQGLGNDWQDYMKSIAIATIGPKTSEACWELFGRVDIEAEEYTLDGLTDAIQKWGNALLD